MPFTRELAGTNRQRQQRHRRDPHAEPKRGQQHSLPASYPEPAQRIAGGQEQDAKLSAEKESMTTTTIGARIRI